MILLSAALDVIKRDNLVAMQNDSGAVLLDGLKDLEARYPGVLKASRGLGKWIKSFSLLINLGTGEAKGGLWESL